MAVKIRLSRIGRKHVPFYRIVAVDSRKQRDGAVLDDIGTYDGLSSKIVRFNEELYKKWLGVGAVPSDTARRIYRLFKKSGLEAPVKKIVEPAAPKVAKKKADPAEAPVEQKAAEVEKPAVEEAAKQD